MPNPLEQIYIQDYNTLLKFEIPFSIKNPNSILTDKKTILNDLNSLYNVNKILRSVGVKQLPIKKLIELIETETDIDSFISSLISELRDQLEENIGTALEKVKNMIGELNKIPTF